jgi:hypothetical protein
MMKNQSPTKSSSPKKATVTNQRMRKSKTPPRDKRSFSASSDESDSSTASDEDEFPRYRENWQSRSPKVVKKSLLRDVDKLLKKARALLRDA